jgi:hypothetical protein
LDLSPPHFSQTKRIGKKKTTNKPTKQKTNKQNPLKKQRKKKPTNFRNNRISVLKTLSSGFTPPASSPGIGM